MINSRRTGIGTVGLLACMYPVTAMAESPAWVCAGREAMVVSDCRHASQAGLDILRAGGNAVDAACAVSFALAVTRPQSTGLGGGGFAIVRLAGGHVGVLDFRETAPARATADMFLRARAERPDRPPPSRIGYLAAAVPGLVRGRAEMLKQYGTMEWAVVLGPAIRLARDGFPVDRSYVDACASVARLYDDHPALKRECGYVYRVHLRSGDLPMVGDRLVQPQLAQLLQLLAAAGPEAFYTGPIALALASTMAQRGGLITGNDLADYRVVQRQPIRTTYRSYDIIGMAPPSSGGITLAETLNILETVDLPALWRSDRVLACHYMAEAMKQAFGDRARYLGDSDFVEVPQDWLTSKRYGRELAARMRPDRTLPPDRSGTPAPPDDSGTSHFCVVDRWGNCVVSTETINTLFGSLGAVDQWGLILNNEMDDFTAVPGEANAFELRQSVRNAVAPGKRPLSSMAPTLVLRNGRPVLLLGASGGPRIISSVLNVMLEVLDFDATLEQAIRARRIHHQWSPDEVRFDGPADPAVVEGLSARGHRVSETYSTGIVQAILIQEGTLIGAADPRKGGEPRGY